MLYRVILIFPNTKGIADFVEKAEAQGEIDGSIYTFTGTLNEEQINMARKSCGAYIRLLRKIEK